MTKTILLIALVIALIGGLVFGIHYSWQQRYEAGLQRGYEIGWLEGYEAGWLKGYSSYEPKTITEIVEVEVEVIKEVFVRHYAREFQDFKQLTDFVKSLDIDAVKKSWWDCDDYAYYLWTFAIAEGWLMSFEWDELNGEDHALNNTVIGNTVYYIDLQAKKIWTRGWLD